MDTAFKTMSLSSIDIYNIPFDRLSYPSCMLKKFSGNDYSEVICCCIAEYLSMEQILF